MKYVLYIIFYTYFCNEHEIVCVCSHTEYKTHTYSILHMDYYGCNPWVISVLINVLIILLLYWWNTKINFWVLNAISFPWYPDMQQEKKINLINWVYKMLLHPWPCKVFCVWFCVNSSKTKQKRIKNISLMLIKCLGSELCCKLFKFVCKFLHIVIIRQGQSLHVWGRSHCWHGDRQIQQKKEI